MYTTKEYNMYTTNKYTTMTWKTICLAFNCITLGTFEIKYNHTSNLQLNWFSCYTHIFKICKMVCKVFKNEPCKTWKTALKKFEVIWSASADRLSRPHHFKLFKDCLLHILLGLCITWQIYLQNFSAILNVLLCRNSHSATTTKNTHKTQTGQPRSFCIGAVKTSYGENMDAGVCL